RIGGTAFLKLRRGCFCSPVNGCNQRPTRKILFKKLSLNFGGAITTFTIVRCSTLPCVLSRLISFVVTSAALAARRLFLLKPSLASRHSLSWKTTTNQHSPRLWIH